MRAAAASTVLLVVVWMTTFLFTWSTCDAWQQQPQQQPGRLFRQPKQLSQRRIPPSSLRPQQQPQSWPWLHHLGRQYSSGAASFTARRVLSGMGVPSNVGWKSGRLDRLTDWTESTQPNRPVICEYEPSGRWLWTKWNGTVLKATWKSVVLAMMLSLGIDFFVQRGASLRPYLRPTWSLLDVPENNAWILRLAGIKKLWEYQLTLATFILTFFLSQAFQYWQKVYNTVRMIQGRVNDFCMLLNMGAARGTDEHNHGMVTPESSKHSNGAAKVNGASKVNGAAKDMNGTAAPPQRQLVARSNASTIPKGSRGFSDKAHALVLLCTRLIRMSHVFFWAATKTASNGLSDNTEYLQDSANCPLPVDASDIGVGPVLLSPYGLRAMVSSGALTKEEKEALQGTGLPPSQYAYVLLVWVGIHCMEGFRNGSLRGGPGFEENIFRQLASLRASMFDIDDFRAGRMPVAYVQLVQVLVDSLVWISPFALYSELGILSVPLTGLLALFFRGLLNLSKSFLDPFGVEGFDQQCIRVDVLVSELNFGASKRWNYAAGFVPRAPSSSPSAVENAAAAAAATAGFLSGPEGSAPWLT